MKRFFLATSALIAATAVASAADLPMRAPAPAPAPVYVAPVFTWSGFYVGVNGGYAGDEFRYPFAVTADIEGPVTVASGKASVNSSGFIGGAQIGYNFQLGNNFVLGIEGDYNFSNVEGRVAADANFDGSNIALSAGSELTSFATVRARAGYSWDRALLYVTGGWAHARIKSGLDVSYDSESLISLSRKHNLNGWALGAGLEYALTDRLSFKTEYLYMDFGKATLLETNFGEANIGLDVDTRIHTVRAGLNYRFWSPAAPMAAPVVAAY